jgi:magnesium chelatase family protein
MLIKTHGCSIVGVNAIPIFVEVNIGGSFGYAMVGLPDNAVKESKERVETAIRNNGYEFPRGKITINLAPADVRKEGSAFDLTIAIGILAASRQMKADKIEDYLILGELSLDGSLQPIKGALPIAIEARKKGYKGFILPAQNADEAGIVNQLDIIPVENLKQAVEFLNGTLPIKPHHLDTRELFAYQQQHYEVDFSEVKGQENIKRGMEVAAAGGHNLLMIGPPGSGKTMLARRFPTILPPLTLQEALETTKIHSVAGKLKTQKGLIAHRPFRSPHHTISDVALVGGGNHPQPGEISLAHNGVLFLDELPEFKRQVLEVMRQPLEDRVITISRAKFTVEYPCNFMLIASMNPCPCGYYNHPTKTCTCTPQTVEKYISRISGPLMDRIDIHLEVTPVNFEQLTYKRKYESSESIRERVTKARKIQLERYKNLPNVYSNAMLSGKLIQEFCSLDAVSQKLLKTAMEKLDLSARAYDRILKVARTIADLAESPDIKVEHVAEAIHYRNLDRSYWKG